jgi:Protein of unknown function (DUF4232)
MARRGVEPSVANTQDVRVLIVFITVLGVAGCGRTKTVTVTQTVTRTTTVRETTTVATPPPSQGASCSASSLQGTFSVVPGSAGAGQIGYDLMLTNTGSDDCWVSGIPSGELLDASGKVLPTNVGPAHPGEAAVRAVLSHGESAVSHARFSPDVPGTGDTQTSQCEPKSHTFRIAVGGGSLDVPLNPPTPVCERGSMTFTNFAVSG